MSARAACAMRVEVVYARPDVQALERVELAPGATVEAAIRRSGLLERFPEIDLVRNGVGVYGRRARLEDRVEDGDRVEIYRPLAADPKEARRARARRRAPGRRA